MAKKRSSLKGRGSEILFGDPPPVEIKPRGTTVTLDETPLPEPEPPEPEAEDQAADTGGTAAEPSAEAPAPAHAQAIEQALFDEAQDGMLSPGQEVDLSLVDDLPPPTPAMEMAFVAEAAQAAEPPEPVVETPAPPLEEPMDEQNQEGQAFLYEPPPPEVSDVAEGVLPPRRQPIYFEMEETEPLEAYDVQAGEGDVERLELPDRPMTPEERERMLRRLGEQRLQALDKEITKIYDQVLAKVGENEEIATDCYNLLLKARDIVLRRDAARISQAEYYVETVRARLKRSTESETSVKKYAWLITVWGFAWGMFYLALLILLNHPWFQAVLAPGSGTPIVNDTETFLRAMVWGGIGGVVAVLYSLFKHAGRRDFDSQYNLSYVGKPFLGLVLGATVYMIFQLMMTVGILPASLQVQNGGGTTVTPWIIYPLAWAGGFKENRIFDLVDRIIKRLFSGEEREPAFPPDFGLGNE